VPGKPRGTQNTNSVSKHSNQLKNGKTLAREGEREFLENRRMDHR
jgi:hypothetical protein